MRRSRPQARRGEPHRQFRHGLRRPRLPLHSESPGSRRFEFQVSSPAAVTSMLTSFANPQEQHARILEAPFDVGNRESAGDGHAIAVEVALDDRSHEMVHAVQGERSLHGRAEQTVGTERAGDSRRSEAYVGKAPALEHDVAHASVPRRIPRFAARCIDDHEPPGLCRGRIELDRPFFEMKRPVRIVKRPRQAERYLGGCRIEAQHRSARRRGGGLQGESGQADREGEHRSTKRASNDMQHPTRHVERLAPEARSSGACSSTTSSTASTNASTAASGTFSAGETLRTMKSLPQIWEKIR